LQQIAQNLSKKTPLQINKLRDFSGFLTGIMPCEALIDALVEFSTRTSLEIGHG